MPRAPNLADIARGKGRWDDAQDTLRLVKMFRAGLKVGQSVKEIDKKLLDTAEGEATLLSQLLQSGATNPALDLAARAYTAWHLDYTELMDVGRYLERHEPDVVARFPGIRPAQAARPSASKSAEVANSPQADQADQADQAEQAVETDAGE